MYNFDFNRPVKVLFGAGRLADPLPLSDADYLEIFEKAYR